MCVLCALLGLLVFLSWPLLPRPPRLVGTTVTDVSADEILSTTSLNDVMGRRGEASRGEQET